MMPPEVRADVDGVRKRRDITEMWNVSTIECFELREDSRQWLTDDVLQSRFLTLAL